MPDSAGESQKRHLTKIRPHGLGGRALISTPWCLLHEHGSLGEGDSLDSEPPNEIDHGARSPWSRDAVNTPEVTVWVLAIADKLLQLPHVRKAAIRFALPDD